MTYNLVEKQSVARFIGAKMSSGDIYFVQINKYKLYLSHTQLYRV